MLASFAATRLPMLEQPFTDFYRAFDAWRGTAVQPLPAQRVIFASNGAVPVGGSGVAPLPSAAPATPGLQAQLRPVTQPPLPAAPRPQLQVDPGALQ